jgi:hypothetical protein
VTEQDTTVLARRLHRLADEQAPQIDVVGQVRTAREGSRRNRRARIAVLAVATATTAVVIGTATVTGLLAADGDGEVATPTSSSPTAPTTSAPPVTEPAGPFDDWETRTFEGVTFAVPPGARTADTVDARPATSWMEGPSLTWNGPSVGSGEHSYITVMITDTYEGGLIPADGGDHVTIPGTDDSYGGIAPHPLAGEEVPATSVWLDVLDGDRLIRISALFPGGEVGQRMAEHLIGSLSSAYTGERPEPVGWTPSTEWETRTLQDLTFEVPPGSSGPDHREESLLVWSGPLTDDGETFLTMQIFDLPGVPRPSQSGYRSISVRGAQEALLYAGRPDGDTDRPGFTMWLRLDDRTVSFSGFFVPGPDGEAARQRVIDSLSVG